MSFPEIFFNLLHPVPRCEKSSKPTQDKDVFNPIVGSLIIAWHQQVRLRRYKGRVCLSRSLTEHFQATWTLESDDKPQLAETIFLRRRIHSHRVPQYALLVKQPVYIYIYIYIYYRESYCLNSTISYYIGFEGFLQIKQ